MIDIYFSEQTINRIHKTSEDISRLCSDGEAGRHYENENGEADFSHKKKSTVFDIVKKLTGKHAKQNKTA